MATAQDIIESAGYIAGVLRYGQSLRSENSSLFLDTLNQMLDEWENDGIDLGLSTLALTDTVYVDSADLLGIQYNLAALIMESVGRQVPDFIYLRASGLLDKMRAKYFTIQEMDMPDTLKSYIDFDINSG